MLEGTRSREQAAVKTGATGDGDSKELSPSLKKIVQAQANRALAERTKSALAVMPIFIIFVLLTPCFSDLPKMVITIGTALFISIVLRVLVAGQARIDDAVASPAWLRNYVITTLLMSGSWSIFIMTVFYHYETNWVFLLLLLSTAGIASAAASSLAPNAKLARTYILVLIAPIMVTGFIHQTRASVTFGVLMTIFVISLLIMIKDNSHQLLSHFSTIERLNLQKTDLETLILTIRGNSDALKHSSVNLSGISGSMSEQAVAMSTDLQHVAASAETFHASSKNVAASMKTVMDQADQTASSIETMTVAIDAIARSTQGTKTIADEAVKQAGSATGKVSELGESAKQVGNISETIKKISEQTNLLALNATIEAARAGDAGKGFAVVANEIKELANQTAKATLEIKNQIDGIQKAVSETMAEIGQISSITSQINTSINTAADSVNTQLDTAKTIAAAVQETSRVLSHLSLEIAGNSETAGAIATGITTVSKAADEVAAASSKVDQGTGALMDLADTLNQTVQIRH